MLYQGSEQSNSLTQGLKALSSTKQTCCSKNLGGMGLLWEIMRADSTSTDIYTHARMHTRYNCLPRILYLEGKIFFFLKLRTSQHQQTTPVLGYFLEHIHLLPLTRVPQQEIQKEVLQVTGLTVSQTKSRERHSNHMACLFLSIFSG